MPMPILAVLLIFGRGYLPEWAQMGMEKMDKHLYFAHAHSGCLLMKKDIMCIYFYFAYLCPFWLVFKLYFYEGGTNGAAPQ